MRIVQKVLLITDDENLKEAATNYSWPDMLSLTAIPLKNVAEYLPPSIEETVALVLDVRKGITQENRTLIKKQGKPAQRIAIGDSEFDNALAKTHLVQFEAVEELVSAIDSVEEFLHPQHRSKPSSNEEQNGSPTPDRSRK